MNTNHYKIVIIKYWTHVNFLLAYQMQGKVDTQCKENNLLNSAGKKFRAVGSISQSAMITILNRKECHFRYSWHNFIWITFRVIKQGIFSSYPARGRADCGVRGLGFKSPGSIQTSRTETSSLSRVVRDGWDPCCVPLSGEKKVSCGGVFDLAVE